MLLFSDADPHPRGSSGEAAPQASHRQSRAEPTAANFSAAWASVAGIRAYASGHRTFLFI
jgi:hypothetical protein